MIVECAHASMEFLDPERQKQHDVNQIFEHAKKQGRAWITGTEAAAGSGPLAEILHDAAKAHGFKPWIPLVHGINTDSWVAVNREFYVPGTFRRDFIPVVPGSNKVYAERGIDPEGLPMWGSRGLTTVSFIHEELGEFNVAASHYIVRKAHMQDLNQQIAEAAGDWAHDVAKGTALAFYAGDQNLEDSEDDTFFGEPLTSVWDELDKHPNTGHGNIDVIASYDRDRRVRAVYARALKDARLPLFTDHFYIEAGFEVARIRS